MAFRSAANDLAPGVVSGSSTVWLRNLSNGYTQLVSRRLNTFNEAANGENRPLAISPRGERVLFSSTGTDVVEGQEESSADRDADLFVFDTSMNTTTPVTVKAGSVSAAANGTTGEAAMSQDGRIVVFESTATDLVANFVDHNGDAPNLYKRDLTTNTTVLVDGAKGSATDGADAAARLRDLSDDGQTVLFASPAADIVDGFADGNGAAADLYVRRGSTPAALVSGADGSATQGADGATTAAVLSAGRIFFTSNATDLNPAFTVAGEQVWTRTTDKPVLVTRGAALDHGANGPSNVIDASGDGAFALVTSTATDLTAPLKHHDTPTLYRVAVSSFEAEPLSARGDETGDRTPVAGRDAMSADGNVVAYTSGASNLAEGFIDGNGAGADAYAWMERGAAQRDPIAPTIEITAPEDNEVYRQDATVLVDYTCDDIGPSGLASCEGTVPAGQPLNTSDTGTFTFTVTATDHAGNTATATVDYRVAEANKKLSLASRTAAGSGSKVPTGNASSDTPVFSADGRYLVFVSRATDLVPGFIDGNAGESDVLPPQPAHGRHRARQHRPPAGRRRRPPARRQPGRERPAATRSASAPTAATCCSSPTRPT